MVAVYRLTNRMILCSGVQSQGQGLCYLHQKNKERTFSVRKKMSGK